MREVELTLAAAAAAGAAVLLYNLVSPTGATPSTPKREADLAIMSETPQSASTDVKRQQRRRTTPDLGCGPEDETDMVTAGAAAAARRQSLRDTPPRRRSSATVEARSFALSSLGTFPEREKRPSAALPLQENMAELVESGDLCLSKGMAEAALHCYTDAVNLGVAMGTADTEEGIRANTGAAMVQVSLGHHTLAKLSFGEARRIRKVLGTLKTIDGGDSLSRPISPPPPGLDRQHI